MAVATMSGRCQDKLRDQVGVLEEIPDKFVNSVLSVADDQGAEVLHWQNLGDRGKVRGIVAEFQVAPEKVGTFIQTVIERKRMENHRNFLLAVKPVGIPDYTGVNILMKSGTGLFL